MKYKGIIFDLDGVICSTDEYHYLAWKALADRFDCAAIGDAREDPKAKWHLKEIPDLLEFIV